MLLAIDVGNTHIVLGVYEGDRLQDHWRIETRKHRPADEYGVLVRHLLEGGGIDPRSIRAIAVSTVVPPLCQTLDRMGRRFFGVRLTDVIR